MVEIYNRLNVVSHQEVRNNIEIIRPRSSIIGCTVSDQHRFIHFLKRPELPVLVDFMPHSPEHHELIFIPANHLLYLPDIDYDCYCMNIPQHCLDEMQLLFLLRLTFQKNKAIEIDIMDYDHFELNKLLNQFIDSDIQSAGSLPPLQYMSKANELMNVIRNTNFDFHLDISALASSIHVSVKTFYRICKSVFNVLPSHMLQYYLQLKIIFRIIIYKRHPFADIADDLNCSDVSSFGRYVKSLSGLTPGEIRYKFYHIKL